MDEVGDKGACGFELRRVGCLNILDTVDVQASERASKWPTQIWSTDLNLNWLYRTSAHHPHVH